ncbi:putative linoleate 9S-lipoxygenase 5 [Senna tora]|uniref:Putative linoleate 9S-lipoxygenase 5 n=1 Tax=Senna tora TaxID=362788 RepID=A0A834XGV0_9FABA|nr:putative linoleate 9S-lipoxygenase 5 [Senna tora]
MEEKTKALTELMAKLQVENSDGNKGNIIKEAPRVPTEVAILENGEIERNRNICDGAEKDSPRAAKKQSVTKRVEGREETEEEDGGRRSMQVMDDTSILTEIQSVAEESWIVKENVDPSIITTGVKTWKRLARNIGQIGKAVDVEETISMVKCWTAAKVSYKVEFEWDIGKMGIPEAFLIKNEHEMQFFLVSLTLEDVPNQGNIHFPCNSWVFPAHRYTKDRVFFANKPPFKSYRIWTEPDEIWFLRGLLDSTYDSLVFPRDFPVFYDRFSHTVSQPYTKSQLSEKLCCLWKKFRLVSSRLAEFPPRSKLDKRIYGDHSSKITEQQIQKNLDGLTLKQALANRKLFVLDYHDEFMPYLRRINNTCAKGYASRTILFLKSDGTLKPLAIELSLPHPQGDQFGALSEVYLPSEQGMDSSIWKLAKAYVVVNDSSYHQLISHWLNTHAVIEPFVIATHRQLSVLHPINKLLVPHFRDTMKINALARDSLVNEGGTIESTFFPGKYAMELSSVIYKNWVFPEQALPVDLLKRGMAIEDPTSPIGIRLVIEDYPYAVDGLEIWFAIKKWVEDYCSIYYKEDYSIQKDYELQNWWKELVEVGHGDMKHEPWWPKMQTRKELIESCTIIIWIASALHAAVNFGQYSYAGFILNRPTLSRKHMPEKGTLDYYELQTNFEKAFLRTITSKKQTLKALVVIEILAEHSYDELYIGQRDNPNWTCDRECLEAFENFGKRLKQIENNIKRRNSDGRLKNRYGPVQMHYTLLSPYSEPGITALANASTILCWDSRIISVALHSPPSESESETLLRRKPRRRVRSGLTGSGPFSMESMRLKWTQEELNLATGNDRARWISVRYRFLSFSILWRHCTAVFGGDAFGHRLVTTSATSCQCVAFKLPRPREYHLSRYASMSAMVSSWDQHGGGRRREDGAGRGNAVRGTGGGVDSIGEEGEAMENSERDRKNNREQKNHTARGEEGSNQLGVFGVSEGTRGSGSFIGSG